MFVSNKNCEHKMSKDYLAVSFLLVTKCAKDGVQDKQ